MRIVFMGTPDFAVASLDKINNSKHQVVGVITAPDKPAGRGRKLKGSPVKDYATQHNIPLLQPTNLKDTSFIEDLKLWQADVFIVVAFRMLPKVVWEIPKMGTINLHASLLPNYRGAAPINWAIINGENKSGVTTFFINEKIDTGEILLQAEVQIGTNDTAGALHDTLMAVGADLLVETITQLEEKQINSKPQNQKLAIYEAPKLNKENTAIHFNVNAEIAHNFIRGLSPFPGAHAKLFQGDIATPIKIFKTELLPNHPSKGSGHIETDGKNFVIIHCKKGALRIIELQIAGKKRMKTTDLLNGFSFLKDATLK